MCFSKRGEENEDENEENTSEGLHHLLRTKGLYFQHFSNVNVKFCRNVKMLKDCR